MTMYLLTLQIVVRVIFLESHATHLIKMKIPIT